MANVSLSMTTTTSTIKRPTMFIRLKRLYYSYQPSYFNLFTNSLSYEMQNERTMTTNGKCMLCWGKKHHRKDHKHIVEQKWVEAKKLYFLSTRSIISSTFDEQIKLGIDVDKIKSGKRKSLFSHFPQLCSRWPVFPCHPYHQPFCTLSATFVFLSWT